MSTTLVPIRPTGSPRQPTPPKPLAPGKGSGAPDWVIVLGAILIAGGAAELVGRVNKNAGYGLAAIIVFSALIAGDRINTVMSFLQDSGFVQGGQ